MTMLSIKSAAVMSPTIMVTVMTGAIRVVKTGFSGLCWIPAAAMQFILLILSNSDSGRGDALQGRQVLEQILFRIIFHIPGSSSFKTSVSGAEPD